MVLSLRRFPVLLWIARNDVRQRTHGAGHSGLRPSHAWRLSYITGLHRAVHPLFAITLSSLIYRREDCILIFVFMSVPMVFLSGISWPSSAMPPFWKYFSYIFPSSLGMNAYPRIMSMGCTLQDIRPLYIGLWAQVLVYFTTSCFVYLHHIKKFVSIQEE